MRIGVLTLAQHSMFSSGLTNTSLAVAELMRMLGHDVEFIQVGEKLGWWDDCKTLEKSWKMVSVSDATGYDLIFEIDRLVLTTEKRQKVASQSVWIIRKPFILQELEASLFPTMATPKRELEGMKEIWMMDSATIEEGAVQVVELLSRVPVRVVPFLWTASIANTHQQEMKLPHWLDSTASFLKGLDKEAKMPPWNVHIAETNTTNASSATLPLVILREAKRRGSNIGNWKAHNTDVIVKSKFFLDNIVRHCSDPEVGLSGEFVGRQRCVEWSKEPLSCVLSHMRFSVIRPMLLDIAWAGVPLVHNSPMLRDIGCGLENYYYSDNHVGEAADAMHKMEKDLVALEGMFKPESLKEVTLKLITTFTSLSPRVKGGWSDALNKLGVSVPVVPAPLPVSVKTLRVGFCDMWENFVPEYNFFILMLSAAGRKLGVEVIGGPATPDSSVVIFGPFGNMWKTLPVQQPKIHFTGENTNPVPDVALNLGFHHIDMTDDKYLRFPLWILEIDWFGADPERIVNPKPIPLERCTKVFASELSQKKKFCAFVVTNPGNPVRNSAFHWLSEYKRVDSAGRLFNNIGPDIFAGTGGGGGELKKLDFLKDYKFCITYENNSAPGYLTEKYLHAKAAGCIPIYWGDPRFEREFNKAGCIHAQNFKSPEELVEAVRRVDEDDSEWLKRFAVPALDPYRVSWAQRTMAECAKRIFALGGFDTNSAPEVIGDEAVTAVVSAPVAVTPVAPVAIETPLMVTYATRKYLPSLQHWLVSITTQVGAMPDLKAIVFLSSDVPEDTGAALKQKFPFATFENVPDKEPLGFADFWDSQHFGWKLWILNEISGCKALAGKMVFYADAGAFLCRWPKEWMLQAQTTGLSFLEDPREENKRWCSPDFCSALKVTEAELATQQIQAATILFRAGATDLFKQAMELSKDRKILVGSKWAGTDNGKPFGHRHDQSILSILSLRASISRYPLDKVQCSNSLRKTFTSGRAVYIHRGNFQVSVPFTGGISEAYVINLARRADRMERLCPALKDRVERWDAVDGRALELTPALQRLLKPNDFFWKKAVTGCAMSHLGLWCKLAQERPDIKNYLIMEDDVKLLPDWETVWKSAVDDIPDDYDIIYLGGVLPPNRAAFEGLKERVNDHFCRVKENMMWGQKTPTRYFHFCAYAYILTRAGAAKVVKLLEEHDGFWTSADHVLCNPVDTLKAYVFNPMIAGCYQDDDPKYANSQFNDFSRIDGFDSDLWNNDERFVVPEKITGELDILNALTEVRATKAVPLPIALSPKAVPLPIALAPKAVPLPIALAPKVVAASPAVVQLAQPPGPKKDGNQLNRRFVAISDQKLDISHLYEGAWLQELFGRPSTFVIEPVEFDDPHPTDSPIFIIQRPYIAKATTIMDKWNDHGATFSILHMSDELAGDDISSYDLSGCLSVLRFYQRPDLPEKATTIPLGYHWTLRDGPKNMLTATPRLPFRSLTWSFFGTDWNNRKNLLQPLYDISGAYKVQFFKDWNDSYALGSEAYTSALMDTVFVPCPEGVNPETFRFYEALECGCIPLIVSTDENKDWVDFIMEHIQILPHKSWEDAAKFVKHLQENIEMMEVYRVKVLTSWIEWRKELQDDVKAWSKVGAQ